VGLDDARGSPPVAPLHRLDQRNMFGNEFCGGHGPLKIGDADAHQPIGLSDQIAQRCRHAPVAGSMARVAEWKARL